MYYAYCFFIWFRIIEQTLNLTVPHFASDPGGSESCQPSGPKESNRTNTRLRVALHCGETVIISQR